MLKSALSNWSLKFWALALAVLLSTYVNNSYKLTETITVPVIVGGVNDNLIVTSDLPDFTTLQVRGLLTNINLLKNNPPICRVDLGSIIKAGLYRSVPVNVPELGGVEIVKPPSPIDVELVEKIERDLEIEANRVGNLPADFIEKELSIQPDQVKVRGAQGKVDLIAHAVVDVELTGIRKDVSKFMEVKLLSAKYQPLPLEWFVLDYPKVRCDLKVSSLSNVRSIRLLPQIKGEPESRYAYDVILDPPNIAVPLDYLKGTDIQVLYTEEVDLMKATKSFERKVAIKYPFKTTALLPSEAIMKVTVVDVTESGSTMLSQRVKVIGNAKNVNVIVQPSIVTISSNDIPLLTDQERESVCVQIDVSDLKPGEYLIQPQVIMDPKIKNVRVVPAEVRVEISLGG
jgi:YbbR domain-containing protein